MKFGVDNEIKLEYLNTKPTPTAKADENVLLSADRFEEMIGKPIYNMSYAELRQLITMQFHNSSPGVVRKNISVLKRYVDYCIEKNIVLHGDNRLSTFEAKDAIKYVDRQAIARRFITIGELREYQNICSNEQDKLLLELPFAGVLGKEMIEIIDLTFDNVDENNKMLSLHMGEGKYRRMAVEISTIALIRNTYEQKTYLENNGNIGGRSSPREFKINKLGNYVFRVPGKKKFEKFSTGLAYTRLIKIKKWVDNPYLTYKSLMFSGMMHLLNQRLKERGELIEKDYRDIVDKYDYGSDHYFAWRDVKAMYEQNKKMMGV